MLPLLGVLARATLAGGLLLPAEPAETPASARVELDWRAPRGCPDAAYVEATIDRLVGPRPPSRGGAEPSARVRAVVHARAEGFGLELHTRHGGGATEHRTFAAPRCDALADAAALIVAVALQPVEVAATVSTREPEDPLRDPEDPLRKPEDPLRDPEDPLRKPEDPLRDPTAVPAPAPSTVSPPPIPAAPAVAPRARPSLATAPHAASASDATLARPRAIGSALAVMVGPGLGVLPGVAAQLTTALALRGRRWRVEAAGAYWFPRTVGAPRQPTVEIGLGSGALRGCYVPSLRRLELPLCGGAEVGAMRGEGRGAGVLPRRSRALFVAAHAGPGLTVPLGAWVAVRVSVDAVVTLRQPGFDLRIADVRTELYRVPPVGARAAVGIELRWP